MWFRSGISHSTAAKVESKHTPVGRVSCLLPQIHPVTVMSAAGAAKSRLNQFYQRCKSPLPRYDVKQAGSGFKCTIICPSVYTSEGSVELQLFTGKGPTKKASQAVAAAEAVKFLQDQPLFAAKKPFVESLWETVKSNLSDQVTIKPAGHCTCNKAHCCSPI